MNIQQNAKLATLTTWQVGGPAEQLTLPRNAQELSEALAYAKDKKLAMTVLGGGSNVLVSDSGIAGLTIGLKNLSGILASEARGDRWVIEALSGTSKSEILRIFLKQKLAPSIFLAGIPGDLGGGVAMNAGVGENISPREFVEITDWIEVMRPDGSVEKIDKEKLHWDYRHCQGWAPGIILKVGLSWKNEASDSIFVQAKQANQTRLSKQPLDMPSCGSVFVNPPGHKAAMLIDSCGLKGYTFGKAQVSTKHANFIVNIGGATASEIWQVIEHVRTVVLEKTKVNLVTEVVKLGKW